MGINWQLSRRRRKNSFKKELKFIHIIWILVIPKNSTNNLAKIQKELHNSSKLMRRTLLQNLQILLPTRLLTIWEIWLENKVSKRWKNSISSYPKRTLRNTYDPDFKVICIEIFILSYKGSEYYESWLVLL